MFFAERDFLLVTPQKLIVLADTRFPEKISTKLMVVDTADLADMKRASGAKDR
jgi:hypothetical protein